MIEILRDHGTRLGYEGRTVLSVSDHIYCCGERWVLMGANGAGKSTFLRSLTEPELVINGERKLSVQAHEIAYLPQAPRFSHQMPCSVEDFLVSSLSLILPLTSSLSENRIDEISSVLQRTGLGAQRTKSISALSGGQVQRLLLARAFLLKAKLFLLDEPFSAVQGNAKHELIELLDEALPGSLQIMALHEPSEIEAVRGSLIRIQDGKTGH
ncbi:MAG: ATP-binding cassette domain-containing protein [Bdellovibrionaceae bacterium]|nr:ATP-binding cassette domain-containing protein [Pseudobdellovibrionaceae bacterium]